MPFPFRFFGACAVAVALSCALAACSSGDKHSESTNSTKPKVLEVKTSVLKVGSVDVDGLIAPPPGRLYQFAADTTGAIRQNLQLDGFSRETGLTLRPLSVLQTNGAEVAGDGLLRQWPAPAFDVQMHYGYAFQWFALATLITGLYVWFQLIAPYRRARLASRA